MGREDDIVIHEDAVERVLYDYYYRFEKNVDKIEDYIIRGPQNTFHGAMRAIYKELIAPVDMIHIKGSSRLNIDVLEDLYTLYVDLCTRYDKVITITGYAFLINMFPEDISAWEYNNSNIRGMYNRESIADKPSNRLASIAKSLRCYRESSTAGKLSATKGNMIGLLAIANHYHSWNAPGISYDDTRKAALAASELPRLDVVEDSPTLSLLSEEDQKAPDPGPRYDSKHI